MYEARIQISNGVMVASHSNAEYPIHDSKRQGLLTELLS